MGSVPHIQMVVLMGYIISFSVKDPIVQYLMDTDVQLKKLIMLIKTANLQIEPNGFLCIVKYIVGQQISDKARETIWRRMCHLCKVVNPEVINSLTVEELRNIGLSKRKADCIKALSSQVNGNTINFDRLMQLTNEEIVQELTMIKGIGRWTAEMYMIFSLGRINVLSSSDGTIKRSIQWMYNLNSLPTPGEVVKYFQKWKGYETIVTAFFWKSIELNFQRNAFCDISENQKP